MTGRGGAGLARGLDLALRAFSGLVLLAVLVFPAYKRAWLGYAPVALAFALVACWHVPRGAVRRWRDGLARALAAPGEGRFTLLLAALPAAAQAALTLLLRPEPRQDALYVYREAVALAQTGHFAPATYYPPGQAVWYALVFKLAGISHLAAQLGQIPLAAALVVWFYRLARETLPRGRARGAALALALYPSFVGYVLTTPYYFYLYTLCLVGMVYAWRRGEGGGGAAAFLAAGILAALAALTKAVMLAAPALALAWLAAAPRAGALRRGALFLLGFALTLAPWTARNYRVFGAWVPVCTSGGLVLYSANNPGSDGLYSDLPDRLAPTNAADQRAYSRWCAAQARAFIRRQPGRFVRLALRKNLHTWSNEIAFAELINRRGRTSARLDLGFGFVFQAGWTCLVLAWFASGAVGGRGPPPDTVARLTAVLVLGSALAYSVFEGGARHHLELVPLLILDAARRWAWRAGDLTVDNAGAAGRNALRQPSPTGLPGSTP